MERSASSEAAPRASSGRRGDAAQFRVVGYVLDGLHGAERHGLAGVEGNLSGGCGKDSEFLKRDLDSHRQLADFALVDLRRGVEDDEESKQKSDEVGVGDQPAVVTGVGAGTLAAPHDVSPSATLGRARPASPR